MAVARFKTTTLRSRRVGAASSAPAMRLVALPSAGFLMACTNAYAASNGAAAIVCDTATFATCTTINFLTNGNFDAATAAASASCSVACVVKQLFAQLGTGSTPHVRRRQRAPR